MIVEPIFKEQQSSPSISTSGFRVFIEEMTVDTFVGIHPQEHGERQPVVLSMELLYGCRPVEGLPDTFIDYEQLSNRLVRLLERSGHTRLLETLAVHIAQLTFEESPAVAEAVISLHKPKARAGSKRMGIELRWSRADFEAFHSGRA
ncbi:dihydroneopterin aldolase [Paraburkholderia fungorum]|jgi:dihydroneopterin aldolase|uniref:dihydroneopterin aldolase n=1 Tax=Paraburkholderia fungorum TaxID=134537 RepID=UPI000D057DC1|nr:dihydroneopterin aldolase [Paraburkholderia fungorum]PRZ55863.1 dihydroneopterin aldolase [Paraburkholderia fungorum]